MYKDRIDSLLRVVSHICKKSREHTTDNIISELNENPESVCLDKLWGTENQAPECLN